MMTTKWRERKRGGWRHSSETRVMKTIELPHHLCHPRYLSPVARRTTVPFARLNHTPEPEYGPTGTISSWLSKALILFGGQLADEEIGISIRVGLLWGLCWYRCA
jgi:hypothetical protein